MSNWDKEFMDEFFRSIERIDSNLDSINITLAKQEVSLTEHVKRSNNLEKHVEILETKVDDVKTKVNYGEGALKIFGIISIAIGATAGLIKIVISFWHFFR